MSFPFLVFILVRTNHDDFLKMGKYSGQCDCVAKKIFCKEHVFLMILSKWGSVRAAVRVLQKCNRLWPLSKCPAVKTTFRHKSDEKEANESFSAKIFS